MVYLGISIDRSTADLLDGGFAMYYVGTRLASMDFIQRDRRTSRRRRLDGAPARYGYGCTWYPGTQYPYLHPSFQLPITRTYLCSLCS